MKSSFIVFAASFFLLPLQWQHNNIESREPVLPDPFLLTLKSINKDSSNSIRIINASSLKRLPAVIMDLSTAFNGSIFQDGSLLDKKGFAVYLYDVTCNSFENSAAVRYRPDDTVYHLKLNRFNQQATDKALAVTLIHEIMHCVLLDIDKRAKSGEEKACASIMSFGLNKNDTSVFFNNDFFVLMNKGEAGQHELISRLFYPHMVSLLGCFGVVHKEAFSNQEAGRLMWSGLQGTSAYAKLSDEEKGNTEYTIVKAKGIDIEPE